WASSLLLHARRLPAGSRNTKLLRVPSAAAKNCSSALNSASDKSAYPNCHCVISPFGSASLIEVPSVAVFTTVRLRCCFRIGNWLSAPVASCGYTNIDRLSPVLHHGQRGAAARLRHRSQVKQFPRQAAVAVYVPVPRIRERKRAELPLVRCEEFLHRG